MYGTHLAVLKMPLANIMRHLLIFCLTCLFLAYLANSVKKYNSGLVSVSVREFPQKSFEFPTVAVCGMLPGLKPEVIFNPVGAFPPWIEWVQHDYIEEKANAQPGGKTQFV